MELTGYLGIGLGVLGLTLVLVILSFLFGRRWGWRLEPLRILLFGVVAAAVVLFVPLYNTNLKETGCGPLETFLISIHNTIRLFVVDGEFDFVYQNIGTEVSEAVFAWYTGVLAGLFVLAPLLTFGFAMTFFKNVAAYEQYLCNFWVDTYVFSELNEKSLALATSLKDKGLLVFTDVFDNGEEQEFELVGKAKKLGAICFKLDITAPIFRWHSKKAKLCFFTINEEDYTENTRQALMLVETYRHRSNTELYVSSTQAESELLLTKAFDGMGEESDGIRVRRIHEVRSLVSRTLYEEGYAAVFASAADTDGGDKRITAVVVGMGGHGTEMTKALAWFGQMDGYSLSIHAFDREPTAQERFALACPELMGPFGYPADLPGEEEPYAITVCGGVDVETTAFVQKVLALCPTYVFVSLGNDERNIAVAVRLRELCERAGCHPYIHAIVYNSDKKAALDGITNFKGQPYDIHFIGDMRTSYSAQVLFDNTVEKLALARHTAWGSEATFWQYSYNYQSSMASAIHTRMKKLCGIPGVEKKSEERTEEELWAIRRLEHRRWNAYMRAEGYVYGTQRYDLAKTHPCLVPFDALPEKEQIKDDD